MPLQSTHALVCLLPDQRQALMERHVAMITAANSQLLRSREIPALEFGSARELAVFFWHDISGARVLSDNNASGLTTACSLGGLICELWGYGLQPDNVPLGVVWKDASQHLPEDTFLELSSRKHIALLADFIRLRAMKHALDNGASCVWFVDLDTHWIQDVRTACSQMPAAAFGCCFATAAKPRGCRAGTLQYITNMLTKFVREPYDNILVDTPFRVAKGTTLVNALLEHMEGHLATPGDVSYNAIVVYLYV